MVLPKLAIAHDSSVPTKTQKAKDRLLYTDLLQANNSRCGDGHTRKPRRVSTTRILTQKIGNCAETYPWVHFLGSWSIGNRNVHGIYLQCKDLRPAQYEDSLRGETWKRVSDPCFNCQEIISIHGGVVSNFSRYSGSAGAPPKCYALRFAMYSCLIWR
ncbi:unnamed protein product [Penicillium roqueforti FM164]|uniref:Genomic scaffold, ProqFM164S02 n=1 Tax=Penicillium roqueforti (strain FM164) TaxID=1365484 RepID=W6QM26_PENRF|nr:unnamed protein product [Penicillium roqueforti FM164]